MTAPARTLLKGLAAASRCFLIAAASAQQLNIRLNRGDRRALPAAVALLAASVSTAAADTVIRVDWDHAMLQAAPRAGVSMTKHQWESFTLSGTNELTHASSESRAANRRKAGEPIAANVGISFLGADGRTVSKGNAVSWTYRVAGNTLFRVSEFDSWTELIKITSTDRGYHCSVEYLLKPGHKYFEWYWEGEILYYSSFRAENVTCRIANQ
jgi:hypothetical protein